MTQRITAVLRGGAAQVLILLAAVVMGLGMTGASAETIQEIQIAPSVATVASDATVPFTIHAIAPNGATQDVTGEAVFSENDPFGSLSGNVYYPGMVGTWTVQATYRGFAVQASITVTEGPLAEISINPNTDPEVIRLGSTRTFTADGFDIDNNPLPGIDPVWAVQGDSGTITADGVFTPTKAGEATITASAGSVTATVRITVKDIVEELPQPAVNTNSTTNTNAAGTGNTNTTSNTNASGQVLGEEIAQTETVNGNENVNAAAETTATTEETTECSTYAWYIWWIGIAFYLAVLGAYYFLVKRRGDMVIWIAPLVLTGLALWAFFALTCSGHFLWVPWVVVIGGLLVTLFRPREFTPTNGQEL